jgi:actin-related protein 10
MSLTEGLVLEKPPAIIIDIGHAYTKCGFSGEIAPHSIIPSKIPHEINRNQSTKIYDYKELIKHLSSERSLTCSNKKQEETLRELLIEFLYRIYYKILNVNSREYKVVIIESVLTPTVFRKTLGDVLFTNFQALSVLFIPSHLAALYTLGEYFE